jgi:hypothetical protein
MANETNELIDTLYEKENPIHSDHNSKQIIRKSPKAKYQIFDELEFTRGREVLGDLISWNSKDFIMIRSTLQKAK